MTLLAPALDGAASKGTIESNGQTLAYEQFGRDEQPALLLIMGLGTQLLAWPDAFCQALADNALRVIRFDNRDVGLSSKLDGASGYDHPKQAMLKAALRRPITAPYMLDDMAADAIGLLDGLGIRSAHVVGASMGGMIAQIMAARYPERVPSLTSMMSSSGARGLPRPRLKVLRRLAARPPSNDEDVIVAHMTRTMLLLSGPLGQSKQAWADQVRKAVRRNYHPSGVARQMAASMAAPSRAELLRGICQPALVIHGRDDPLLPAKHGRDTARHLPNARYEEISGMGHCLPPGRLAEFVGMIVALVRRRDSADQNPRTP